MWYQNIFCLTLHTLKGLTVENYWFIHDNISSVQILVIWLFLTWVFEVFSFPKNVTIIFDWWYIFWIFISSNININSLKLKLLGFFLLRTRSFQDWFIVTHPKPTNFNCSSNIRHLVKFSIFIPTFKENKCFNN